MIKQWKDIKIGDKLKDGSKVTQIHRTHTEECCKVIYDTDKEFICSYRHILLVDVHNLSEEGKQELNNICTYVPLEEDYEVWSDKPLIPSEKYFIQQFCRNENIPIKVDIIEDNNEIEIYNFHFDSTTKKICIKNVIIRSEPQKVDENTYWLTCRGIEYLMHKYNVELYCNDLIINSIINVGNLPCFCISTDSGKYET